MGAQWNVSKKNVKRRRSQIFFGCDESSSDDDECEMMQEYKANRPGPKMKRMAKFGKSSAARVSRGSEVDTPWKGLTVEKPERHDNEHVTATIVMYYTCSGGVPTEQDVKAAIDDL